ncbi:MAG: RES family NAD+ phosphorylase [Bacteroidota bacterium]|nr:RES family NAD+ phosphorylase [Bacteroidota bacterium]
MLVYRITLTKYANQLVASGRAARWNPNDVAMIYTASSRSLACLENVVHRDKLGLSMLFSILTIECPISLKIKTINLKDLPANWIDYDQMTITQRIGEKWIRDNESAILQVPSSIVSEEVNYLINPKHPDFKLIKIVKAQPFVFDSRIKL